MMGDNTMTTKIYTATNLTLGGVLHPEVKFREPTAGDLRGIEMIKIMMGDPDNVAKLLARCCLIPSAPEMFSDLPAGAFMWLHNGIMAEFFLPYSPDGVKPKQDAGYPG